MREPDPVAEDMAQQMVKRLLASPEFIASQRATCLRLMVQIRGPLEELRAGLARLQDSHLMLRAIACQNQLATIRLGLISELDAGQRVAFTEGEEEELREFEATATLPSKQLLPERIPA